MNSRTYYYTIDGKQVPDEESMAAYLLDEGILFVSGAATDYNNKKCIGLCININDYFCPGSDAESVTYEELPILFELYNNHKYDGVTKFVAEKRGIPNVRWIFK